MKKLLLPLIVSLGLCTGCSFKDKVYTPSEAEKNLVKFCQEEGSTKESPFLIATRLVNKTLWIYVPLREDLFNVKPSDSEGNEKKTAPLGLLYLGGQFDGEKNFAFNFDIVPDVLPPDPPTYSSGYNEGFTRKRQMIYQGIQETIFNTEAGKIDFIVIMVVDIKTGVGVKSTIYLNDLKQYMTEALPPDEYYFREVNDVFGDKRLVGDRTGEYVPYAEVQWPSFLVDQIKTRVHYKFSQSNIDTTMPPENIIAAIAANTVRFYPFSDYKGLYLFNIREKKDTVFTKDKLDTLKEKSWWEGKGKLTTIHFNANDYLPAEDKAKATGAPSN